MNSIVSAAAITTATAIPSQRIATTPMDQAAVSFPELLARFVRIRDRWNAQQESDKAYSAKIGRLFFEATGVSRDEYLEMNFAPENERWRHLNEISNRLYADNPDENDPYDGSSCSTVWPVIQDEVDSVALAMLSRPPQSLIDLAWQTEALLLAEDNLRMGYHEDLQMLPKLFENIRFLSGPLRLPSIVPPQKADPIFAAIEAHRAANDRYKKALEVFCEAENSASQGQCCFPTAQIQIGHYEKFDTVCEHHEGGGLTTTQKPSGTTSVIYAKCEGDIERNVPKKLSDSAQKEWIASRKAELKSEVERIQAEWSETVLGKLDAARADAYDVERDRIWDLIWTIPTTARGLAALLRYINEHASAREMIHDDEWEEAIGWTLECAACRLAGLPAPAKSKVVESLWNSEDDELIA